MAKKYSKHTSNYILSQPHKNTEKGLINLRDWTTIGEIERLDRGKKPVFGNGNFKFTIRNVASNPTKHVVSKFIGTFDYNDVKDALPHNNLTELNIFTNDLRDFAYYGSASDLVRGTIQNIIRNFPARIKISDERILGIKKFVYKGQELSIEEVVRLDISNTIDVFNEDIKINDERHFVYLLDNPFNVDLHHESLMMEEYVNPHRFLTYSFKDFIISSDGVNYEDILKYSVTIEYNNLSSDITYDRKRFNCVFDGCKVAEIKIQTQNNNYVINGYLFDNQIKWGYICDVQLEYGFEKNTTELFIQTNNDVFEKYFTTLNGLEKILLRRDTKPLYFCHIKTPILQDDIIHFIDRGYQFPSQDGFIDISSPLFTSYVNQLGDIALIWDQTYCDNLYQRMTHEAIKNYDWTYKKDEDENEIEENIIGGLRIESLLRIYGRLFDDIKMYIDGIKNSFVNTYDGYNNMPTAHITDSLEECGWHIVNTIPVLNIIEDDKIISKEFGETIITDECYDKNNNEINWFTNRNKSSFNFIQNNLNFMKKLFLNSNYIFQSKGTRKSIEMIMGLFGFGDEDFEIEEVYYETEPKEYTKELYDIYINLIETFEGASNEDAPQGALPIKIKNFNGNKYYVPFLDYNMNGDADLHFQCKGGWGKFSEDINKNDYTETMSYLKIKYNLNELFTIPPIQTSLNDIFYVIDLTDYVSIYNAEKIPTSHYFVLTDIDNVHNSSGWENIDLENKEHEKYKEYVEYMENIVATNLGNNPHVGYGRYDIGNYYIETMKQPFKYIIENFKPTLGNYYNSESDIKIDLQNFEFSLKEKKVKDSSKIFFISREDVELKYYINSKVVRIINKHKPNKYFSEYFKEVILQYIMQVVPSTTILILKDF